MFPNPNCFSKAARAEKLIPLRSCRASRVIKFWQTRSVPGQQRVIRKKIFDLILTCWLIGHRGQVMFCLLGALAASSCYLFPSCRETEVLFLTQKTSKKPAGKCGQMLCSGYETGNEGWTLVITKILTNSR